MIFCPKDGGILKPKKDSGKTVMVCSKCNYVYKGDEKPKFSEKIDSKAEIDVVDSDDCETLPQMDVECPKCKNKKAYYWLVQTRAGDEPQTKFLKCTKCKHVWRDYD